jgi:hypothetical protein
MPKIEHMKKPLKDPIGAIARRIERDGNDFSYGKTGESDFVRWACETLRLPQDYERDERIANELFEDMGERYGTPETMAAFLYVRLTV